MRFRSLLILFIFSLLFTGCVYYGEFAYLPNYKYINQDEVKPIKIAVLPFEDVRGRKNMDGMILAAFPLVPYGPIKYERVENGTSFFGHESLIFNPADDIPQALVSELNTNNIFKHVVFTKAKDTLDADYIISGQIIDLTYKGKFLSYGLGGIGVTLLITGIPAGIVNNYVDIKISVFDVKQNKELLEYKIEGETKLVVGLYYKMMDEFNGYAEILNNGFKNFVIKLNDKLN